MLVHVHTFLLLLALSLLSTFANGSLDPEGADVFCYDEGAGNCMTRGRGIRNVPSFSTGVCASGKKQSPIDIPAPSKPKRADLILNDFWFHTHDFRITNSHGHTLQGDIHFGTKLIAEGSLMEGQKYILDSFHFHWGSKNGLGGEHTIGKKSFAAEMHLVHYNAKYGNKDAAVKSGDPKGLAVIGILFEHSPKINAALDPILKITHEIRPADAICTGRGLNLGKLLFNGEPEVTFAHYTGSLTTPGCNEVVLWNVKTTPTVISAEQLEIFRSLFDDHNKPLVDNYRKTQPLNGRQIQYLNVKSHVPS